MEEGSITAEELEYEYLRSLCDLAIAYRRLAETYEVPMPRIATAVSCLEDLLDQMGTEFGDVEIVL